MCSPRLRPHPCSGGAPLTDFGVESRTSPEVIEGAELDCVECVEGTRGRREDEDEDAREPVGEDEYSYICGVSDPRPMLTCAGIMTSTDGRRLVVARGLLTVRYASESGVALDDGPRSSSVGKILLLRALTLTIFLLSQVKQASALVRHHDD
ncbi:hypothetical protein C8R44DRAFT_753443 [Mycena epipterygia]|nr:hypothetical protein C8R44DRAFT_753443 [Mycena epipterygia]